MKKTIILIYITLFVCLGINAQTTYFSDTVYNPQLIYPGIGANVIQSGNGYTITPVHYDYSLSLIKTDSLGNFKSSRSYNLFGSQFNTFPFYSANIKLRNNHWLMPIQTQPNGTSDVYESLVEFDSLQTTVLNSRLFQFNY